MGFKFYFSKFMGLEIKTKRKNHQHHTQDYCTSISTATFQYSSGHQATAQEKMENSNFPIDFTYIIARRYIDKSYCKLAIALLIGLRTYLVEMINTIYGTA